jgi:hypothetical protein
MFIIKDSHKLSSPSVIGSLILSIFLSTAIIIVVSDNSIVTQADAKEKVTTPFSIPTLYLKDNNHLLSKNAYSNTSITTANISINDNDSNSNSLPDISDAQQGTDKGNNINGSSYLTYQDNTDGISLIYPSNWQKIEYPSGAMNYGEGHRIIASFLAPLDPSDQWRGSLNVQISNPFDLKNIISQNANTTMTNLAGHNASKVEYTNTERMYLNRDLTNSSSVKLKVMQIWTTIGDNTYVLTYNAEASKYQQYLPIIEKMLSSFKVS